MRGIGNDHWLVNLMIFVAIVGLLAGVPILTSVWAQVGRMSARIDAIDSTAEGWHRSIAIQLGILSASVDRTYRQIEDAKLATERVATVVASAILVPTPTRTPGPVLKGRKT